MTKWIKIAAGFYSLQGLSDGYIGQVNKQDDGTWTAILADRDGNAVRMMNYCKTMTRAKNHVQNFADNTYVTRTNLMSKKEYQESITTPYFCSPSSETYWSS